MGYSYLVTHPRINPAEQGLTLLSARDVVLSLWYSDSTLNAVFLISKMRKANKQRKKISHTGWENKVRNEMRGMKMRIITCFGDRARSGTFFIIVSDKYNR